jgi:Cdc6-like AAA superfamily ATPase
MSIVSINEIYSEAKKALNVSAPDRVVGRFKENEELETHILSCLEENKTMSLYVNGQPGTGKTLTINHLIDNLKV